MGAPGLRGLCQTPGSPGGIAVNMSDTQWPRFMVFQQMEAGQAFVHQGTVHAPDIEMALLNGRDVFVRRPNANAMFVVPADLILSKTEEEIKSGWEPGDPETGGEAQAYLVFGKLNHAMQSEQLGDVQAVSPPDAMKKALEKFSDRVVHMWWVFPAGAVLASGEKDLDSMFKPVLEHGFKNQANYPVITMMRQIKSKGKLED